MREATDNVCDNADLFYISIHASHAGSDLYKDNDRFVIFNFNPRFPCGKRRLVLFYLYLFAKFQSTLPMREATHNHNNYPEHALFQSTLPMREATHNNLNKRRRCIFQSTLPMREATSFKGYFVNAFLFQSTLPMREATKALPCWLLCLIFQSTLPMREATYSVKYNYSWHVNFNPRFPCGKRLSWAGTYKEPHCISIHASHAGSDCSKSKEW